jgi:hypothetical protein
MKARLADTAGPAVFGIRSAGERQRFTDPAPRLVRLRSQSVGSAARPRNQRESGAGVKGLFPWTGLAA